MNKQVNTLDQASLEQQRPDKKWIRRTSANRVKLSFSWKVRWSAGCANAIASSLPTSTWRQKSTDANRDHQPNRCPRKCERQVRNASPTDEVSGKVLARSPCYHSSTATSASASPNGLCSSMRSTYEVSMNICTEVDVLRMWRPRQVASWPSESPPVT